MSKLDNSTSANRRVSGVTGSFPSLLLARTEVLALALRFPAASLERSRRAAVAALSGLATSAIAAITVFSAVAADVGVTATGEPAELMAATLIAATRGFDAFMAAAVAATTEERAADLAAPNVAAVDTAAEGVTAVSWAAPGAAAPAAAPSLLLTACCSHLLLSFSLLLSLGGRFLPRLRVAGALDTVAAADEEIPLQQKFNSSSPSTVSRVRRAHLLSLLQR
jgi:hypothetical protein